MEKLKKRSELAAKAKRVRYTLNPISIYENQQVSLSYESDRPSDHEQIWLNFLSTRSTNSICLTPEEALHLGKLLYKIAYDAGYVKTQKVD